MKKLRIFVALHDTDWEKPNLIWTLQNMFDVVWFDWGDYGYSEYNPDWKITDKSDMNVEMVEQFKKNHAEKPFDLFFGYLSDVNTTTWAVEEIKSSGVYCMNFGCNNVGSFKRANTLIANQFDVTWTVDRCTLEYFAQLGANALYTPLAINPDFYIPDMSVRPHFDVGLVGRIYGYRSNLMLYLRDQGNLSISMSSGVSFPTMFKMVSETAVNIIPRGIGNAEISNTHMKQIRLRDFEVTALAGLSLSEEFEDLGTLFEIGKEVVTFDPNNLTELIDICKYYAENTEARNAIREAGYNRCIKDHTWEQRFNTVFKKVGLL